jgi:hypothetical protein
MQGGECAELLLTAIARMHAKAAGMMCELPAAAELPGSVILLMLRRCIVHKAPDDDVLKALLRLAAAMHDHSSTATAELAAAAEAAATAAVGNTAMSATSSSSAAAAAAAALGCSGVEAGEAAGVGSAVAQQSSLGPTQLLALLEAAVQHGNSVAVQLLSDLPAAQQLGTAALHCLTHASLELGDTDSLIVLCGLPGMQALSVEQLQVLLSTAGMHGCFCAVLLRHKLKASADIPPQKLCIMISMAIQTHPQVVADLLMFPAAQQLSTLDAQQLLNQAITSPFATIARAAERDDGALRMLLQHLPAASHISGEALTLLMRIAIQWRMQGALEDLSEWPAVSLVTEAEMMQLYQLALETGSLWAVPLLANLPVAQQIDTSTFGRMVHIAMLYHRQEAGDLVRELCEELSHIACELDSFQVGRHGMGED